MQFRFGSKQVIPLLAVALGIIYVLLGFQTYGFWDAVNGPRSGFFPAIAGGVMVLGGVIALIQSFKEEKPKYRLDDFGMVLAVAIALLASYLIGLVPAVLLMVFVWLKVIEKAPWKTSLIVTAVMAAIVISVFVLWLQVPFPRGLIGELFY